MHHFP